MLQRTPITRLGQRDRTLLWLGFAGAFRRSELVALDIGDLDFSSAGLTATLAVQKPASKARASGWASRSARPSKRARCVRCKHGSRLPGSQAGGLSAARSVQRAQNTRLSAERVAPIVKRRSKAVRLDPERCAGHFLASGASHQCSAGRGASERVIMSQTGHRSADMVRKEHPRRFVLFDEMPPLWRACEAGRRAAERTSGHLRSDVDWLATSLMRFFPRDMLGYRAATKRR